MDIVERRVRRHGPVMVKLANGTWIEEDAVTEPEAAYVCGCGLEAKTLAGLLSHQRAHSEEE